MATTMTTTTAEIMTIGDELLRGELCDTNASWLAAELHLLGVYVTQITSMSDDLDAIHACFMNACDRTKLLIVTGGLGPTEDDRTVEGLALALGEPLILDESSLEQIKARFAKARFTFTPNNERQAYRPKNAIALANERGTAPGVFVETPSGCVVVCMPGVPHEMKAMFHAEALPRLKPYLGTIHIVRRHWKLFGIGESHLDQELLPIVARYRARHDGFTIHYRATFPEVHLTAIVRSTENSVSTRDEHTALLDEFSHEITPRVAPYLFSMTDEDFSGAMVRLLRDARATLAIAESCSGGLTANLITDAPGSSDVFKLGVVAYANEAKEQLLGVHAETLQTHGAVSQACVEEMAHAVKRLGGTDYGIAISGIAGPGGGTPDKPVGTVHFAVAGPQGTRHLHRVFNYDRERNKRLSAYVALWLLRKQILNESEAFTRWAPKTT